MADEEVEVFKGKIFRLTKQVMNGGIVFERVYQRHGITIFPITDTDKIRFVRISTLDNPTPRVRPVTGYIEDGEEPLTTAKRELKEELELTADTWIHFMTAHTDSVNKEQHCFIAYGLHPAEGKIHKDPCETTEPVDFSHEKMLKKTLAGEFGTHENAFMILAFLLERERPKKPSRWNMHPTDKKTLKSLLCIGSWPTAWGISLIIRFLITGHPVSEKWQMGTLLIMFFGLFATMVWRAEE